MSSGTHSRRCVGCERRASDVLCRGYFEALPLLGRPFCGRCGAPTAFEVFGCGECRTRDFGFDGARAPLRYEGVGKELVHALKYRGYLGVVGKVMGPLMSGVLDVGERFDVVTPVPLHRSWLAKRGFNQAELMAKSVAQRISAPVLDKLKLVRRTRDQIELSASAPGERLGRVRLAGSRRGQSAPRGRCLYYRRYFERVCQGIEEGGRGGGLGPDPVQYCLSSQLPGRSRTARGGRFR